MIGTLDAVADRLRRYQSTDVSQDIHPRDIMFEAGAMAHYLAVGRSAIEIIARAMIAADRTAFNTVLDLPSGAGRVTRHLRAFFPEATLYVAELDAEYRRFAAKTFAASEFSPPPLFDEPSVWQFDLIFVGSLLTHLDADMFVRAVEWLIDALAPNGILVMTTHGRTHDRFQRELRPWVAPAVWDDVSRACTETGFGYVKTETNAGGSYGISWSSPSWTMRLVENRPDVNILGFQEAAWDSHQDVVTIQKCATAAARAVAPAARDDVIQDCQLNVNNFDAMQSHPAARYQALRFDPNNTCNLHCVYCHNHRSEQVIDIDAFKAFVFEKIIDVSFFQVGCIMEPTLDPRLSDFISIIGNSPARPKGTLVLQTNGLLLHRHDHKRMVEDGLTNLSVSLDVADPELQKELRGGMSLAKVIRNVEAFRVAAPTVEVEFISVVTKSNVNKMAGLVDMALSCGAHRIVFRELLYYSESKIVDHTRMRSLLLDAGEFQRMTDIITAAYSHRVELIFSPNDVLDASAREMIKNSDRKIELRPPVYHSSSLEPHVHGGG